MLGLGLSISSEDSSTNGITLLVSALGARLADDGGTIENPSCMQQDLADLVAEETPFTTGLLEFYPGAAAAYSLRQLRRSVFPYAIRVRRSSDSQEQDIGFNSNGELDTNALLDFADGGDAWVATWYDQSSNGNDATQGTDDYQPQIVSSGSLITENGKPAVDFDGTNDSLDAGAVDVPTMAISVVAIYDNLSDIDRPFAVKGAVTSAKDTFAQSTDFTLRYDGTFSAGTLTPSTGTQYLRFSQRSTSAQTDYVNTLSNVNDTETLPNIEGTYSIGNARTSNDYFDGKIQEAIAWESDQSANRAGIESNINDFYSIYS